MNSEELTHLLHKVKEGTLDVSEALPILCRLPYTDLGFARVDCHRELRTGYPEVIYCEGKTKEQIRDIFSVMEKHGSNIIGTRADRALFDYLHPSFRKATYYPEARIISLHQRELPLSVTSIAVITAGTSDLPVAEEAAVTAELLGNNVLRIYDAGVAGIHRLFDRLDDIRRCRVIIVIAGMEGALASIVGGLVNAPLIAVPTSVGYGASFNGLSALLTMLTSCVAGITVVNIDNGFGAGFAASRINQLK